MGFSRAEMRDKVPEVVEDGKDAGDAGWELCNRSGEHSIHIGEGGTVVLEGVPPR